jgi:hypothetical protein
MFLWNKSRRLAQDRAAGACVQLAMVRHGERLSCAVGKDPTELDVLPRWEWTVKPKRPRIATISAPERRRRLGIRRCQLHRDDDRGVRGKSQGVQVFALEVQANGLLQAPGDLVQGRSLRDDGDLDTFGYISRLLTGTDDRPSPRRTCPPPRARRSTRSGTRARPETRGDRVRAAAHAG